MEKIRALLAKARDAGASEAEAETCARKARELMDRLGVSEADVGDLHAGAVGAAEYEKKYMDPWRRQLITCAARYYGCVVVYQRGTRRYEILGREAHREVAASMIDYLETTVIRLAREWRRENGGSRGDQLNFERGCGTRIAARLMEMHLAGVDGGGDGGGGTALARVSEVRETEAWMAENRVTVVSKGRGSKVAGDGGRAGREAGDGVGLGGQVRGGARLAIR